MLGRESKSPRRSPGNEVGLPLAAQIFFINVPSFVLIPFKNAVAELAESVPCKLTAYVFARAVHGNSSQLSTVSSPCLPLDWPTRKRVAVMVEMPIPSPRNKMALLAVLVFGLSLRLSSMSLTPSIYHWLLSWFRKRSSVTPKEIVKEKKVICLLNTIVSRRLLASGPI